MTLPVTLAEFAEEAARRLPEGAYGYFAGGAGDELTLRENVAGWQRIRLRPRVLTGAAGPDHGVSFLGASRSHPLVVAPMAFQASAHPGGEAEFARGAGAAGAPFCLSTLATTSLAALAAEAPHAERWYQVYVFRDRGLTRELVAEATELGYRALVVTVDLPVFGRRDRDLRSGFAPTGMAEAPMVSAAGGKGPLTPAQAAELLDPTITWSDLEQLVAGSRLPVLVKGLLDPADAGRAAACGAAGVVVSNHGARQLDTVAPTAEALGPVVDLVGDRTEVFVDGGVRRGTDVVKALALGARGVLVGRPLLWAFAVAGAAGVARAVEILLAELDVALTLTGVGGAVALDRSVLGGPGPPGRPGQVMS